MKPLSVPLSGDGVRADPLTEADRENLRAACAEDEDIWEIYALNYRGEAFDASFDRMMTPDFVPFTLYNSKDVLIGMSSFINIFPDRQMLEIGNTYYRPRFRGNGVNRPIKDMMMRHAFDCGYTRIEYRVDTRNARSQAAMTKLGAIREGVMRQDRTTWTGYRRDTVLFSILKNEWNVEGPNGSAKG